MNVKSHPTRVQLVSGFVLAVALSPAPLVCAEENSWIAGNGNWEDASNWSLSALPVNGDNVRFDGSDYAVNKMSSSPLLGGVSIVGDKISLNLYFSGLNATNVLIGDYEHSYLNQIDNSATSISETLTLGQYQQAFGQYIIGQFVQDQNGTWQGLDGGTLHTANAIVGDEGYGHFHQLRGTTTIDGTLTIALQTGAGGWFGLGYGGIKDGKMESTYGGTLNTTNIIVGAAGNGLFHQQSGTTTIKETLTVGKESGSSGWVRLGNAEEDKTGLFQSIEGGALSASNFIIGDAGDGDVNQTNSDTIIAETLTLGEKKGSDGLYLLGLTMGNAQGTQIVGGGTLSAENAIIGNYGTGNFHQFNGDTTIKETITIAQQSGAAGSLALGYNFTDQKGAMHSVNGGTLNATDLIVGDRGNGKFHQQSGTTTIAGSLTLGKDTGSEGWVGLGMSYVDKNGVSQSINGGTLSAASIIIGDGGDGYYHQMNGTTNISSDLIIARQSESEGTVNMDGGVLSAGGITVGVDGEGELVQSAGTVTTGAMDISSGSEVSIFGGTLNVAGTIINNHTLNYSGGVFNASLTNNGDFNLSGTGTRIVNGDVTNNGTIKTTDTIIQFTGTFTNHGAYISDPSTQYFENLVIGKDGYLQGGVGDKWVIAGDLTIDSESDLWDTALADLEFSGTGEHIFDFSGSQEWNSLTLDTGAELVFSTDSASIRVDVIEGLTFNDQGFITNIGGAEGLAIYYDPLNLENQYLMGQTFHIEGGGSLEAQSSAPVPVPSALLLLSSGIACLAAGARRRS